MEMKKWFERKDPVLHRALGGNTTKSEDGNSKKKNLRNEEEEKKMMIEDMDDENSDIDQHPVGSAAWKKMNITNANKAAAAAAAAPGAVAEETDAVLNIPELATKRRIRQKDKLQRNALHVACANRPSLELIQLLYERYPAGVDETDKVGRLPLHTACANHADVPVIEYLLQVFPDSIHECTDRGASALFCAIENKASLDVLKVLVHADPESMLLTQYKLGRTPVHAAVVSGNSLEVINYLLELRPLALAEQDAWGKTPLACACMNTTSDDDDDDTQVAIVQRLIDNTRIRTTDRGGMLPLHIACQNNASLSCLHLLLDAYPSAIRMGDKNGRLPLHAACTNPRTEQHVLAFLIEAYPDALKTFDKVGSLPLHLSIQRRLNTRTVLYLMTMAEGAARTKEASSHMYALHMACRANADEVLIERLIQVYPEALDAVDVDGNTFFHTACKNKAMDIDFIQLLLDKCSYQIMKQPNKDGCLPLHLACQSRLSYDVIALMVEYYPQGLLAVDNKGNTPLHKAFQCASTELKTLVRLAQLDHRALQRRNKRGDRPEDCVGPLVQKHFRRARIWYNLRLAYCPVCIWHKE